MARFEVLDEAGEVVNTIIADREFVEAVHPGRYRELVEVELPAPAPPPPVLTQLQFRLLLTQDERLAARALRETDAALDDFLELMDFASEINLGDPLTVQGLSYAASLGLFTPERLAAILAGTPPA